MTPQQYEARIKELQAELAREREEKLWWRDQLRGPISCWLDERLGLSPAETNLVLALYQNAGRVMDKKALLAVNAGFAGRPPMIGIIQVQIYDSRTKLKPFGITIKTVWGIGYSMPVESARLLEPFILRRPTRGA